MTVCGWRNLNPLIRVWVIWMEIALQSKPRFKIIFILCYHTFNHIAGRSGNRTAIYNAYILTVYSTVVCWWQTTVKVRQKILGIWKYIWTQLLIRIICTAEQKNITQVHTNFSRRRLYSIIPVYPIELIPNTVTRTVWNKEIDYVKLTTHKRLSKRNARRHISYLKYIWRHFSPWCNAIEYIVYTVARTERNKLIYFAKFTQFYTSMSIILQYQESPLAKHSRKCLQCPLEELLLYLPP